MKIKLSTNWLCSMYWMFSCHIKADALRGMSSFIRARMRNVAVIPKLCLRDVSFGITNYIYAQLSAISLPSYTCLRPIWLSPRMFAYILAVHLNICLATFMSA